MGDDEFDDEFIEKDETEMQKKPSVKVRITSEEASFILAMFDKLYVVKANILRMLTDIEEFNRECELGRNILRKLGFDTLGNMTKTLSFRNSVGIMKFLF